VRVYVNDSTSYSANATLNLKVNTDEKIGSFSASPNSTVVGTSIRFAVSVSGGTPPYSYLYSSLPTGCSSSDVASLICTPTASGNYTTTVNVKDAAGGSTNASTSLTVTKFNPYLHIVSFVASPATIVQGTSTNFSAVVAGGALMYTYDYSNLPLGCSSVNMSAFQCTPTETGNFNVSVKVTDARGNTTSAITSLIVIPSSGSWPTILSVTLTPNPVVVGQAIKVSVRVTGGVPPYTYVYVNLPPGCLPSNSTPVSCKPTSPGNYTLLVTVIDSAGRRTEASTLLVVTGPIVPLTVSLLANVSSVMVGQPFYLEAQVVGGEGQFLYYWSLNGTNVTGAPDSSIWNITLNHPGTYTYRVWVEDLRGVMVGSQSVQVTASGPGNSSGLQFPWWILLVILVVVVIVILLLIGYRRQVPKQARTGQTRVVSTTGGAGATDAAATGSTKTGPDADTSGRPPLPAPSRSSGKKCSKCGGPLDPDMTCPACSASSRIKPETGSEKPHTTGRMSVAGLFASRSPSHAADGKGSKADAEQTGPPVTIKCIICGTELDGDYCKVCNMHWDA
jgi:ribosomal protein L33